MLERFYNIPQQTLRDLYNGRQVVDSATFLRSSSFQLLAHDALKYRMSQAAAREKVVRPIPKVNRPGIASDGPRADSEYAELERQYRGKELSPKQAAALLMAKRAR